MSAKEAVLLIHGGHWNLKVRQGWYEQTACDIRPRMAVSVGELKGTEF